MKYFVAFVVGWAFSGNVGAHELFFEVSLPAENQDAFVVRIAPRMYAYTHKTGHEVCGALRFDGHRYFISVSSSGRNDECALPGGTDVYVHTHPINQGFHFSKEDYVLPGYLIAQHVIKFQNGRRVVKIAKRFKNVYTF